MEWKYGNDDVNLPNSLKIPFDLISIAKHFPAYAFAQLFFLATINNNRQSSSCRWWICLCHKWQSLNVRAYSHQCQQSVEKFFGFVIDPRYMLYFACMHNTLNFQWESWSIRNSFVYYNNIYVVPYVCAAVWAVCVCSSYMRYASELSSSSFRKNFDSIGSKTVYL